MINYTNKNAPIGIFDSGIGGISVLNEAMQKLPNENFIYYGDTLNAPYGEKDIDTVKTLVDNVVTFLIKKNIKALVIACNTATSTSVNEIRKNQNIPIIGIEPAITPAVEDKNQNIGVFATNLTLKEEKFSSLVKSLETKANIYKFPAPKLVNYVEKGDFIYDEFKEIIDNILKNKSYHNLDSIVLGCTHYVFLKDFFKKYFGENFKIYDGNEGVANHLKNTLKKLNLENDKIINRTLDLYSSNEKLLEGMKFYVREKSCIRNRT